MKTNEIMEEAHAKAAEIIAAAEAQAAEIVAAAKAAAVVPVKVGRKRLTDEEKAARLAAKEAARKRPFKARAPARPKEVIKAEKAEKEAKRAAGLIKTKVRRSKEVIAAEKAEKEAKRAAGLIRKRLTPEEKAARDADKTNKARGERAPVVPVHYSLTATTNVNSYPMNSSPGLDLQIILDRQGCSVFKYLRLGGTRPALNQLIAAGVVVAVEGDDIF